MKILPFGVAVIEGDTHLSKWVEQHGTLKIAEAYLALFKQYVPDGGTVIDVGAMIGDHTVTYAEWVGPTGQVLAFEPNPAAFECLRFNMKPGMPVLLYQIALSEAEKKLTLVSSDNAGASFLSDKPGEVVAVSLDELLRDSQNPIHFIKIDAEGFETKILWGARKTIATWRPVMLIEINHGALIRAGTSASDLLGVIRSYGYQIEITDKRLAFEDAQFDVLAVPMERRK